MSLNAASPHASLFEEIRSFVFQKDYPCVAAVKAARSGEFLISNYQNFGEAEYWQELRRDLQTFAQEQRKTGSTYLTYWAVFSGPWEFSESEFETRMWNELSHLSSVELKAQDWGSENESNPQNPGFCLSIDGQAFFVVGLHPQSSRLARRFSKPALVFNAIQQFENLERDGQYESMKQAIRKRDIAYQGSVNPMVLEHGDVWEAIQFSGKKNDSSWKCPFHFLKDQDKTRPRQ